jgi:predicted TPR repeat methyltransferase
MEIQPKEIPLPKAAWRILADAEEVSGDCLKAIEALQEWAKTEPQFATKVAMEVGRIRSSLNS